MCGSRRGCAPRAARARKMRPPGSSSLDTPPVLASTPGRRCGKWERDAGGRGTGSKQRRSSQSRLNYPTWSWSQTDTSERSALSLTVPCPRRARRDGRVGQAERGDVDARRLFRYAKWQWQWRWRRLIRPIIHRRCINGPSYVDGLKRFQTTATGAPTRNRPRKAH
jgi:hypothetical protein